VIPTAFESVTVNPSSGSTIVSPTTLSVITLLVSFAAKLICPVGKVPPKSALVAGFAPLPATEYVTLAAFVVNPIRVTLKVNGVVPEFPSNWLALAAVIARELSSFRIVPTAVAVLI